MKRTVMLAAGVMALSLAVYVSNKLWAQAPATGAAPQAKTRVGLINLTYVIKNYAKFKTFQEELKKAVEPFQAKDTAYKAEGEKLAKEGQAPGATAEKRDQIEKRLKQIQREIEDNKTEAQKVLVKQQEAHFVGRIKGAKCPFDLQFLTWDFS